MHDIIFRGRRVDTDQWISGSLAKVNGGVYILDEPADISYGDKGNRVRIGCFKKVKPDTVSVYTNVAPVVHGGWTVVDATNENQILVECSVCKEMTIFYDQIIPKYCPYCGAKMEKYEHETG